MVGNRTVYWVAQFTGWLLYFFTSLIYNFMFGEGLNMVVIKSLAIILLVGISISHLYRYLILRFNWLTLPIPRAMITIVITSVLLALVMHVTHGALSYLLIPEVKSTFDREPIFHSQMIINWAMMLLIWSILYFTSHYFANYKKEEIKNLKMLASQNEIELINLKAQLNPHFMFNALNSIRALVDEDPSLAKTAITQLSAMLRGALQTGKRQLISLEEELSLVTSYLAIEKIRFEERLKIDYEISGEVLSYNIPPLMLQTLVENAVKHGISSLTRGGHLVIIARKEQSSLLLQVKNDGTYVPSERHEGTGIGLKNTERRLGLLYGKEAAISMTNENKMVVTTVIIPKNLTYENIDN
jgi:two-component system LytT family sensor kinase